VKRIIFSLFFCFHINCFASAGDAAVGVATAVGVGMALSATSASGLAPYESDYWVDPRVKTTTKLTEQCGLIIESKIYNLSPFSVMFLGMKNNSNSGAQIFNNLATVNYNNEVTKYFDLDLSVTGFLPAKMISAGYLKFHQKSDFRDATTMLVKIPVMVDQKNCDINITYAKNPEFKGSESLVDSEITMLSMYLGPTFIQGDLSDLTSESLASEVRFEWNVLGASNNGMYLDLGYASARASDNYKSLHPLIGHDTWSIGGFGIGYVKRFIINEDKNIYLRIGGESGHMSLGNVDDAFKSNSPYAAGQLGLRYNVMFSNVERGYWRGKYYFNLGLNSRFISGVEFDGVKSSGSLNSLLFGISVGM